MEMESVGLGKRIRDARKIRGYRQSELGELCGMGKTTISCYEINSREPNITTLQKIMKILQVDANYLFQDYLPEEVKPVDTENELVNTNGVLGNIIDTISPSEAMLLKKYRELSDRDKRVIDVTTEQLWISKE